MEQDVSQPPGRQDEFISHDLLTRLLSYTPLVENLKLQVRMNIKTKAVELRTSRSTTETGAIQKGEDFVRAYAMGFDVEDAVAILRLDGIYIQSFEIKDVKTLEGDHLARAVGRIVGKDGRTKYAIENTTKTRIVVAGGSKIHILGGFKEIGMARESVVSLMFVPPFSFTLFLFSTLLTFTVSASHQARCTATCGRSARVSRSGSRRKETYEGNLFISWFLGDCLGSSHYIGPAFIVLCVCYHVHLYVLISYLATKSYYFDDFIRIKSFKLKSTKSSLWFGIKKGISS